MEAKGWKEKYLNYNSREIIESQEEPCFGKG